MQAYKVNSLIFLVSILYAFKKDRKEQTHFSRDHDTTACLTSLEEPSPPGSDF